MRKILNELKEFLLMLLNDQIKLLKIIKHLVLEY